MGKLKLPPMKCDSGCGECCGLAPVTDAEYRRVEAFVRERRIKPVAQGVTCPFFQKGVCAVYSVRPLSCQLFGHTEGMTCPHGHNTNIRGRKVRRAIKHNGPAGRVLHELLGPNWKDLLA